jgi:hypothetical protein
MAIWPLVKKKVTWLSGKNKRIGFRGGFWGRTLDYKLTYRINNGNATGCHASRE